MRKLGLFAILFAVGMSATLSGCYGNFSLVRKAYAFNKNVSRNKFVQEGVFLVMSVIPVYGVAAAADAIVLNTIEFWTGKNPVASNTYHETRDGVTADAKVLPDGRMQLSLTDASGVTKTTILAKEADGISARAEDGTFQGKVADASTGTVLITPRD